MVGPWWTIFELLSFRSPTFRVNDPAIAKVSACPGQPQNESGTFPMPDEACYDSR
jgi:hypothetical protein